MRFPFNNEQEEFGELATPADAMREFAYAVGPECADRAWLLTDYDVWVRNPAYTGPDVRHPEDDYDEWEPPAS